MQTRPGARRSATSRKSPIRVFSCHVTSASLAFKVVRSRQRIDVKSCARLPPLRKGCMQTACAAGNTPAADLCPRRLMESASHQTTGAAATSYPTIVATATALPPFRITREDVKVYMGRVFDIPERRLEAMMSIVDNAQVHKRHSIFPLDYTIEPRPLSQTNNEYIEHAVKLGREAAEKCLERAGLRPDDIDLMITVSCTGFMIPSLDAHLINLMGFRSNVRRMPFTELGCAAGAMALGRAADYLKAEPGGNVLIIAVELPSLTF